MASYTQPINTELSIFTPQYWEVSSTSYLTLSQAQQYFLSINGNEIIGGFLSIEGGISTNIINPLASGDTITINSTTNIIGDLLVNGEPISGDLSGDITTDNIYPIASGDQLNIWTTGILNYYGNRLCFNGQPQYSILYSGETMQILSAGQPCIWNGVYQRCGIWQSNPQYNLDVSGSVNSTLGYYLNGSLLIPSQSSQSGKFLTTNGSITSWTSIDQLPSYSTANNNQVLGVINGTATWEDISNIGLTTPLPPSGYVYNLPYTNLVGGWDGVMEQIYYNSSYNTLINAGLMTFGTIYNLLYNNTALYTGTYIGVNYSVSEPNLNNQSLLLNFNLNSSYNGFSFVSNTATEYDDNDIPIYNIDNNYTIANFTSSQAQFPSRINFLNQGSTYCSSGSMPANSWLYYSVELPIQSCSGVVLVNFWNTSGYWNTAIGSLRGTYGIAEMTSQGSNPIISSGISNNIVYITFTVSGVSFYTTTSYYTIWVFTDGFNDDN